MGKTEIKCRETEGTAGRKKDDWLDDMAVVLSLSFLSLSRSLAAAFSSTLVVAPVRMLHVWGIFQSYGI